MIWGNGATDGATYRWDLMNHVAVTCQTGPINQAMACLCQDKLSVGCCLTSTVLTPSFTYLCPYSTTPKNISLDFEVFWYCNGYPTDFIFENWELLCKSISHTFFFSEDWDPCKNQQLQTPLIYLTFINIEITVNSFANSLNEGQCSTWFQIV